LISCESGSRSDKNEGILANSDTIASIKQALEDKENSDLAQDGDVFWTPSGSLWHESDDCSYLANSKTVYHGSVEQAKMEGKERVCTRCSASSGDVYDQLKKNPIQSGDVFFTKDGNIFHRDINCNALKSADNIYYASEERAKMLGKSDECSECR
jgi:hypothetical protein